MKKFLLWSLLAAAGVLSTACEGEGNGNGNGNGGGGGTPTPPAADYEVIGKNALGEYFHEVNQDGTSCYNVMFATTDISGSIAKTEVSGSGYVFLAQFFVKTTEKGVFPTGIYKIVTDAANVKTKTCFAPQSAFLEIEDGKVEDATGVNPRSGNISVTKDGDIYTIEGTITLADSEYFGKKQTLHVKYVGKIEFPESKISVSSLEEDLEVKFDAGQKGTLAYYADKMFDVDADSWSLQVLTMVDNAPVDGTEGLQLQLLCPKGSLAAGLPAGTYDVSDSYATGQYIALKGVMQQKDGQFLLYNSWYIGEFLGGGAGAQAPADSGKLTVTREGDSYTFAFDFLDDAMEPHKFFGTWTGVPKVVDGSKGSAPIKAMGQTQSTILKAVR